MKGVTVKKSKIHGKGVFAARNFRKGGVVLRWNTSYILTKGQLNKLPKKELMYVSSYGRGKYILHQPPVRYVNHSCEPNTKPSHGHDVTIHTIRKGQEITTDYRYEGGPKMLMLCDCGATNCRKFIAIG